MTTRDERLAALEQAVTEWADQEEQRLNDEVSFLRSVFSGRTNGAQLSDYLVSHASSLLENEINAFLEE